MLLHLPPGHLPNLPIHEENDVQIHATIVHSFIFVRILLRYKFKFVTSVAVNSPYSCLLDSGLAVCRSCMPN